ncbi:MAG: hypothetical protein ABIE03_05005 [Patescibacteria group bacterium]|nr:hypothetical protein [Patescibacteria group bacterium]
MKVLKQLSSAKGTKSQEPNKELAEKICGENNRTAVEEIIENLNNSDKNIQSDCAGMVEYIGLEKPDLISKYVNELLDSISSKNNRLVWGAMIALSAIADVKAGEIYKRKNEVVKAIESGSVITIDNGIKVLAKVSARDKKYSQELFPYLIRFLERCRLKSVPQYAESISVAVNKGNRNYFKKVLTKRIKDMKEAWRKRVAKVLRSVG